MDCKTSEQVRALRGARQGIGQSSVNKADGRTDCVTHEQSSVEGRAEVKAKVDKLCFFLHSFIFPFFYFA